MWRVNYSLPVCAVALSICAVAPLCAQQPASSTNLNAKPDASSCNPWLYQPPSGAFSFKQRACFQFATLATPYMAARGAAIAGLGTWQDDRESFGRRYAAFYARNSAKGLGELV